MKKIIGIFALLLVSTFAWGQQISKEEMLFLTPLWKGERFADGRPKASDALLQRLKSVTLEEAWAVLKNENLKFFLAALDNKDLADVFKNYGLDKIFSHFKADEIRQNGKEWEEILAGQNFDDIIKYLPLEIVRDFNKDTILSTFMKSDEESLGRIKHFFSLGTNS
jgi:hypothetical protein